MDTSTSAVKTVMDVKLGNGQWRQYTTEVRPVRKPGLVLTDTVASMLEDASEDLRIDELDVGIKGIYMDRFPLRPGYQIRTCLPFQRLPYPERVVDFLHQLARFYQEEQPHSRTFTFDYELPPQEFQDDKILKALEGAFNDWCGQFDIIRRSFQSVNGIGKFSAPETFLTTLQMGEMLLDTVLTVRVFQRPRFARLREEQVLDKRMTVFRYLENQLSRYHNRRLKHLELKMEMTAEAYRYLARKDFDAALQRLSDYYPIAYAVQVILPGDDPLRPGDERIPFTITIKDED